MTSCTGDVLGSGSSAVAIRLEQKPFISQLFFNRDEIRIDIVHYSDVFSLLKLMHFGDSLCLGLNI